MSTAELKSNLHELIDKAQDSKILKIAYLLLSKKKANNDWWLSISEREKAAIERGLRDIKDGKVIPHEKAMEELKNEFPEVFR